jgi:hypothetical protein
MFFPSPEIVFGLNVFVLAAGGLPTANIELTCRESEKAITSIFGDKTAVTYDGCMRQERDARDEIAKKWTKYSATSRQRCINTTGYMPSYVEWLTCLEMDAYLQELRKNGSTKEQKSN